ncbi:LacI family DNA-binding transcriptional regulator [Glycomyces tenuis]|uniref:LacI family DNA-binding transcriptional regulator n=2 Tax=Glycomyces tenuis TaxID=58116 RepID=UPI0005593BC9|nr:LacI family DNA-binding transcriptional regulator [Glycomyces tenuis]
MREVARAAGVSTSTVGNVVNNPQRVAPETRRRVERAMAEVGFVRSGAARQLRGVPSRMVGVVTLDTGNPFYAEVNRGIEDRLADVACMALFCSTDGRREKEDQALTALEEQGVRGIIITPVDENFDRFDRIGRRGTPVVLLDQSRGALDLCAVATDNLHGGKLAAEHLLSLGHTRIALLWPTVDVRTVLDRRNGIRQAVDSAGLDPERALVEFDIVPPHLVEGADEAVGRILASPHRPTAVICFNDLAALGAMRGLKRRRVRVPEDLSLVGFDDLEFAAHLSPELTTVNNPKYELGRVAADMLLSEADTHHRHREICFQPSLSVRDSAAAPPHGG